MQNFTTIFLIFGLFIFLFSLFLFVKEDFFFLRKNISLDEFFSLSFIIFFIALFFSRFVFVIENFKIAYLSPLVFLALPYFPGLSFSGGLISGFILLVLITRRKNYPIKRIADIFLLSFMIAFDTQLLLLAVVDLFYKNIFVLAAFIFLLIVNIFMLLIFRNSKLKDGSVGYLSPIFLALTVFVAFYLQNIKEFIKNPVLELLLLAIIIFFGFFMFIKNEYLD